MEVSVRIRTVITVLAVAMVLMVAAPASAQEKGAANFAFGYSNLTSFDPTHNTPAGRLASIGVGITANASFVGEVGGFYESGASLHTFQGGVRFAGTSNPKATPFFQVVTGLGRGGGTNVWALTPGGGFDVKVNDKAGVRIQVDLPIFRSSGVTDTGLRISGGVVVNIPKG